MNEFFKLRENNTTVKTEIFAGITTFMTMAYIIFVNPNILKDASMDPGAVFVATILSAAIGTLVMGLFANAPFAQAAGMGLNAFFTYYVVLQMGYTWQGALALVFICGIINILITVTKLRVAIVNAIPDSLKNAISAGIGLFIALIGFINAGLVVNDDATLVALGDLRDPKVLLAVFGLVLTVILMVRKVNGSILIGIIATTIAGIIVQLGFGVDLGISLPQNFQLISLPPSLAPTFLKLDFSQLLLKGLPAALAIIISFSLVDTFDTIGTFIGASANSGVFDEKDNKPKKGLFPRKIDKAMIADATATSIGALLGTSNVTTYVESTAGISAGGRTGLTAVVTAICFLLCLFIAPVVGIVPTQATAPALIIVGVLMIGSITKINFSDFAEALPAFLAIVMMPFAYSISEGISLGFISYTICMIASGKAKKVHPIMYGVTVIFIIKYILGL